MTKIFNHTAGVVSKNLKRFLFIFAILLTACADDSAMPAKEGAINEQDIVLNNRGVALMGRFEYRNAGEVFEQLVERHPDWHDVRTNLAIALKNRQEEGDSELALEQLGIVLASQPEDLRANYVAGVLQLYLGRIDSAASYFDKTLAVDSGDAYAHYYLGQCQLRLGDEAAALASYQAAIELDPYLRSAYYSAAQVLRRLERNEQANAQLAVFKRFENNPRARLAEFKYTRMGPKSLALVVGDSAEPADVKAIPAGPLFSDKRVIARLHDVPAGNAFVGAHMTTVDIDQNGGQDLFLATGAEAGNRLLVSAEKPAESSDLVEHTDHPWESVSDIKAVAWGDVDNDGLVDAYLCRSGPNQLWLQVERGEWKQAAPDANVDDADRDCADATMVDADHDGDLDILIGNRAAGDNLLNNNRDGTFRSLADKLGDAAKPGNTRHLVTADLDGDNDVDLIFVNESAPHRILINDRLWNYVASTGHNDLINTPLTSLAAVDLDTDGQIELLGIDDGGEIKLWQTGTNGKLRISDIYESVLANNQQVDLAPLDVSGNGHAELVLLAAGGFEVIALNESNNWAGTQVAFEKFTGSRPIPVTRSTRGISLIALGSGAEGLDVLEWSPGAGRFKFATLTFSGKHDAAETMRSNHSGIGTRVSVRAGTQWSSGDTHKHSSLAGYSLQPLSIGLAGRQQADFVAIEWSDGVYQTELDVESESVRPIAEEQRQLGSCPVLFAWNGEKFDFVTDILGVAAQGFLVEPGTLLPPRPWERVTFAPGSIASSDGLIKFKVTEPMEENSYIDAMTLESYDVPANWQIVVDERMGTGEPEVTGETMFYQKSVSPARAFNSSGEDVRAEILEHDQQAMPPGDIDRRFIGLLKEPETLTIEFDAPIESTAGRLSTLPVLVAESWVELPYSQTHFSAWQAGRQYRSVTLEARGSEGAWQIVHPEFGIPGGMPRTIGLPLRVLPTGTDALRLSWNREIYWDRIRIVYAEQPPVEIRQQTLSPKLARVAKSGFYKRLNHAQRRPEYVYQQRSTFADVKYPTGFYTNLGEMTELLTTADDALAIIGPGEEIHVEFDAPAPPAAGMQRWYVFEAKGWAKDKDMYTYQGNTVGPLPRGHLGSNDRAGTAARASLHQKYNTRFQSGR